MSPHLLPILSAWVRRVDQEAWWRLPLAVVVTTTLAYVLTRATRTAELGPTARRVLVAAIVIGGLLGTVALASVTDDAFISLRYARNLLEGHGLVFNIGERVEGETNLLWVLVVAAVAGLSRVELPTVALALNLALAAANLYVCAWRGQRAARRAGRLDPTLPVGAALLAFSPVFRSYSTTGLETGLATLLVQLGAEGVAASSPAWAGLWFALAALTRPDLTLFYGIAALLWLPDLRAFGRHLSSASLLAVVTAWRLWYYGDLVPNTAYAKSASIPYWSQGFVYDIEFWLGSYGWTLLAGTLAWVVLGRDERRARGFVGLAIAGQVLYVTRLGGDFMAGRFFVCLLPLLALACEQALATLLARGAPKATAVLAGVLAMGINAWSLVPPGTAHWYLADEGSYYRVRAWPWVEIDHPTWTLGMQVGTTLADRGIEVRLSSGMIGMLGYYGRQPLLDHHGLTDRTVAHSPLKQRARPGHEKFATRAYLSERRIQIAQSNKLCGEGPHPDVRAVTWKGRAVKSYPLCFVRWDPTLARELREKAPEWQFVDLPTWLDVYLAGAPSLDQGTLQRDATWLDAYYFADTPDPARRARLDAAIAVARPGPEPSAAASAETADDEP